jgi:peptide/nickel transport system substrate-binding protein
MGSSFVFNEGVKWHDGEDFTVDDVIYTINRWQNPPDGVPQPRIAGLLLVDSMEKVDDLTLNITHTKPTSRILPAMADAWHIIFPEHVLEKTGGVLSTGEQVIGTGPFKVESYSEGNNVVSVANPDYFQNAPDGSPFPYLDGITGIAMANNDLSAAALATGQVDYYTTLTPSKSFPIKEKNPSVVITRWDSPGFQGISMNTTKAPFDDLDLRKAFACGLNTHAIAELSSTPGVVPMEYRQISFFGTADPNYENVSGLKCVDPAQREANEAESKAVFQAKGFTEVEFDSDTPDDPIATIVQQQMKALGVDVKVIVSENTTAREKAYAGNTTLFFFGQAVASKSPVEIINQVYRPGAGFELYQETPPARWSELLDQLDMATLGSEEEKALTAEMDTIMWNDWMPKVPVRRPDEFQVKQDYVRNIDAIATAKFIQSRFVDAWLDK